MRTLAFRHGHPAFRRHPPTALDRWLRVDVARHHRRRCCRRNASTMASPTPTGTPFARGTHTSWI